MSTPVDKAERYKNLVSKFSVILVQRKRECFKEEENMK
jgi:hypothetical protein